MLAVGIAHPPGTCPECGCRQVIRQRPVDGVVACECLYDECATVWAERVE